VVIVAHLWLADDLLGRARAQRSSGPVRLEVAFVTEMQPGPVLVAAAAAPPPTGRPQSTRLAAAAIGAADAPHAPASAPESPPPAADPVPEPPHGVASAPSGPAPAAEPAPTLPETPPKVTADAAEGPISTAAATSAPAAGRPAFEWPLSTRLSYRLTGYYRGPVEGQAQVEWLRRGARYQVHLEVSIGPSFAPLMSRRMTSDGEITPQGLSPGVYFEETRVALASPRRRTVALGPDAIRLADGREVPRPAGVQDSASQFVQMIWWFTTQPERLLPGQGLEIPLALPNRVEPWTYDVLGVEPLHTPLGLLESVHVKPRRAPRPGGDLVAESWIAPALQYLPVRIVIRQDEETFVDLMLDRAPVQAAPDAATSAAPAASR